MRVKWYQIRTLWYKLLPKKNFFLKIKLYYDLTGLKKKTYNNFEL
jgi:hypothetical protein